MTQTTSTPLMGNRTQEEVAAGFWNEYSYRIPTLTPEEWARAVTQWEDINDPDLYGPGFAAYHAVAHILGLDVDHLPEQDN